MADDRQQSLAELPIVYASALRLGVSFADVRLYFGEAIPAAPPADLAPGQLYQAGSAKQVDRLCIVLSPDLMPAIIDGLQKAVQFYQSQFGSLRTPPQQVPPPPQQQ